MEGDAPTFFSSLRKNLGKGIIVCIFLVGATIAGISVHGANKHRYVESQKSNNLSAALSKSGKASQVPAPSNSSKKAKAKKTKAVSENVSLMLMWSSSIDVSFDRMIFMLWIIILSTWGFEKLTLKIPTFYICLPPSLYSQHQLLCQLLHPPWVFLNVFHASRLLKIDSCHTMYFAIANARTKRS